METLFELTFQDQTLTPQVGTFTDVSQTTGTFTLEDGEYYLTNADTKGFYAYSPVALQSGLVDDSKVIIEFDLKVVTASVNTHTIIGTYAGVDGSGIPTGAKITLQYNAGDIELVLDSGATATLIESADVVVDQWYHFRIDCFLAAPLASTYQVKIDGVSVTTVTGATTDYELGIISVLGTDLHACDECGIKNITLVTETNMYVGRTALDQALQDVKGYADDLLPIGSYIQFAGSQAPAGFLVCNGGEISRTTYSALFDVIGTTYGSGDGSTTFNLPNLTDRFLQGSTTSGTVKNAGLPNITGVLNNEVGNAVRAWGGYQGALFNGANEPQTRDPVADLSAFLNKPANFGFDASRSSSIYGSSATVQPPALTCLICIKY